MTLVRQEISLEKAFGQTLKRLREAKGFSQEELADRCRIHRTYVSQLERGLKSPTLRLVWQVCESMEIDPTAFIGDVNDLVTRTKKSY